MVEGFRTHPLLAAQAAAPTHTGRAHVALRFIAALLWWVALSPALTSQINADFTANVTSGTNPLVVSFTDTTTGAAPLSWLWEFGDGAASQLQNPTHTYTLPGMRTVSLHVIGPGFESDTETKVDFIDVAPLPLVADFSASATQGTNPFEVTFTDLSSGSPPTDWLWDFGDGGQSTAQNPIHVFGTPGTFDVSLTVFIGQQADTLIKSGLISVDPATLVADFTATPTGGNSLLAVSFTDTSLGSPITAWSWDFGDGATSIAANPSHTYHASQTTSFDVSMTVWIGGQSATKTQVDLITVEPGLFDTTEVLTTLIPALPDLLDAADFDGDGDLDVLASDFFGDAIFWWPNLGGAAAFGPEQLVESGTEVSGPRWMEAADVDGDGDPDVLYSSGNALSWTENIDGAGHFVFAQFIAPMVIWPTAAQTVDLDGDGNLDLLLAHLNQGLVAWFENTDGLGTFGAPQTITNSAPSSCSVDAADFDGDGDLDVLAGGATPNKALAWFPNLDGAGNFGPAIDIGSHFIPADWVAAGDLDDDGDLDAAARVGGFRTFMNTDGQGNFGVGNNIAGSLADSDAALLRDVDGDADLDIVVSRRFDSPTGGLWWHENLPGPVGFEPMRQLWEVPFANDAMLADLDADGDDDALATTWAVGVGFVDRAANLLGSPEWPFLGDGLQGVDGMPLLQADGNLSGGATVTLSLSSARPGSSATLVLGISLLAMPFKGGVLVPHPDVVPATLPVDGNGKLVIAGSWPAGVPAGLPLWLQYWIADPAGPVGFAASNAVMGTTVP